MILTPPPTGSDPLLPRADTLTLLITSMQKYPAHHTLIKDVLLDLTRCIAPTITPHETQTLLSGTITPQTNVRTATLQAIESDIDLTDLDFSQELWLAAHDESAENAELAKAIWDENVLEVHAGAAQTMLPFLDSPERQLRAAAARALRECVRLYPECFGDTLERLKTLYLVKAQPILPSYDEFGLLRKTDNRDPWESRSGIALAFKELAAVFDDEALVEFSTWLIGEGALGDRHAGVREEMVDAATAIVAAQGAARHVEELMGVFERSLAAPDDGSELRDRINEAVIILYGALGRHLGSGDARIPGVVDRLLETLGTPSETVQYAVAECLPPLIKASRDKTSEYVQRLLDQLFTARQYAARRGAAYGLAGVIKGRGISALKDFRIMSTLKSAVENKKDANMRQGALFAFELLSLILGRLFEPYVIQLLPLLLQGFGDSVIDVREACSDAAKVCFSSLSSYGVKVILPDLLDGLDESAWRSKKGACETLGAMAYLAPHQLAISLPDIIPPLTTVLNDSHKEVRLAANRSLKKFGEVISNPEVKDVVEVLLRALSDPTKYTEEALDVLMKVSFVHYLDAPSLALVWLFFLGFLSLVNADLFDIADCPHSRARPRRPLRNQEKGLADHWLPGTPDRPQRHHGAHPDPRVRAQARHRGPRPRHARHGLQGTRLTRREARRGVAARHHPRAHGHAQVRHGRWRPSGIRAGAVRGAVGPWNTEARGDAADDPAECKQRKARRQGGLHVAVYLLAGVLWQLV